MDGICISSVDATGLDSALTDAISSGVTVGTWDSDVSDTARSLMVSQGTPDILGQMLVDMGADSLTKRGKDPEKDTIKYCWHYSQATVADQNSWQEPERLILKKTSRTGRMLLQITTILSRMQRRLFPSEHPFLRHTAIST